MAKLRLKGRFVRERIRNPSLFSRLRTKVQGKHRIIVGRPRGMVTTRVQAILHPKSESRGKGKKFVCKSEVCKRIGRHKE